MIRDQVEPGATVLDLGCGDGSLLASLQPSRGVGVDFSLPMLADARRRHPDLDFVCGDVERLPISGTFDYVIASNVVGFVIDVNELFRTLTSVTHPSSRVIVAYYNFAWEPVLWLAERFGTEERSEPLQSWLSNDGLANLVEMADLEVVKSGYRTPLPVGPAWLTRPLNNLLSAVPLVNRLGLISFVTARPRKAEVIPQDRGADVHRRHPGTERAREHPGCGRAPPPSREPYRADLRRRPFRVTAPTRRSKR